MIKNQPLLALIVLLSVLIFQTQAREIRYNNSPAAKEQYLVGMLKLAIEKSGDKTLVMQPEKDVLTDQKFKLEVMAGNMQVYWGPAVSEHTKDLKPIFIPLVKGLLGYRLFIIKNGHQHKFDGIRDLQSLKQLVAGQGSSWGDTLILRDAGIPLETSVKYPNLFYMLEGERFDYFPRGAHEPWSEVENHRELGLTIEKRLALVYPLAMIFYVNKSEQGLADTITRGLETAIADGSFDDYFYNQEVIKSTLELAQMKKRTLIRIPNNFLPKDMPLDRKELWLDVDSIP